MGRLQQEFLERVEAFCDRVLDVAEALAGQNRSRRLVDQVVASGTSVGANVFEADEGMSRADFCKCLSIAIKDLNETRFWLRLIVRRGWLPAARVGPLESEGMELKQIMGAMLAKTRDNDATVQTARRQSPQHQP